MFIKLFKDEDASYTFYFNSEKDDISISEHHNRSCTLHMGNHSVVYASKKEAEAKIEEINALIKG